MIFKKAYAKINLALEVLSKMKNGYHGVNTIMIPIDLYDILKFEKIESGFEVISNVEIPNNSMIKAYNLLKDKYNIDGVRVYLEKNIPIAAGLAGGSSDLTNTLTGINELYGLNISKLDLEKYAALLGSDTPFFVNSKLALCTGRGEVVNPINISYKPFSVLLIKPNFGLSTKEIYANYCYEYKDRTQEFNNIIEALKANNMELLKNNIFNDLYKVSTCLSPQLINISNMFKAMDVNIYQSGSGPTLYILDDIDEELVKRMLPDYFVKRVNVL